MSIDESVQEYVQQLPSSLQAEVLGIVKFLASGAQRTEPDTIHLFHADPAPLRLDEGGVVRIGTGRVALDTVIEQYENGMIPEDMVRVYEGLSLSEVHAIIAYYLRHRDEVRAYLKRREEEATLLRRQIESSAPPLSREELAMRPDATG